MHAVSSNSLGPVAVSPQPVNNSVRTPKRGEHQSTMNSGLACSTSWNWVPLRDMALYYPDRTYTHVEMYFHRLQN